MTPDAPTFDLQSHSTQSDGVARPRRGRRAGRRRRRRAARADRPRHGRRRAGGARRRARARHPPARRPPSSRASHGEHEDLHILGYEIDPSDPGAAGGARGLPRRPRAAHHGDGRPPARARLLARRLLLRRAREPRPPAPRRRRARAPRQRRAARARGHRRARSELFPPYLVPGAAAYVARSRPTVEEAIEVIHAAGGVAIWAHPFWDIEDREQGAGHGRATSRRAGSTASSASTPSTRASRR